MRFCICDCYVDEPACLGVPPFLSPYPRYVAGALLDAGADPQRIQYLTIDHCRANDYRFSESYDMVFLIGGSSVPGRYLGSRIGTAAEIRRIIESNDSSRFAIGGPVSRVITQCENVTIVERDIEAYAWHVARGEPQDARRDAAAIRRWSILGAGIVRRHHRYPHIICEIETSRGCPRRAHCSFCSEGISGAPEFRPAEDILAEIDALAEHGITRFRIGRQADILSYGSELSEWRDGLPRPAPKRVRELIDGLRQRIAAGTIRHLNVDNANPGVIAAFPEESFAILEALADTVTPGDTLALGVESFDEEVVWRNFLKANPEKSCKAVEMVNRAGSARIGGMPKLLPGVNLLHGLWGESPRTFEINFRFLSDMLDRGLLIKRINIRQVLAFPGTPLHARQPRIGKAVENRFRYYRDRIRREIELPMTARIYPVGTVLRGVQILESRHRTSLGKQIASYAITAVMPLEMPLMTFTDVIVTGHRERSVEALPLPIDINALPTAALEAIPGIGKKRAAAILLARPYRTCADAGTIFDNVDEDLRKFFVFT